MKRIAKKLTPGGLVTQIIEHLTKEELQQIAKETLQNQIKEKNFGVRNATNQS